MKEGCSRGEVCPLCENTNQKGTATRAVYQASCVLCQNESDSEPGPLQCELSRAVEECALGEGVENFPLSVPEQIVSCPGEDNNTGHGKYISSPVGDESNSSPKVIGSNSSPVGDESNSSPVRDESNSSPGRDESNSSHGRDGSNSSPGRDKGSSYSTDVSEYVDTNHRNNNKGLYIGETSRQVGTRIQEHVDNLKKWNKESFMLLHWMAEHGTMAEPPSFTFKTLATHKDALSRQLHEAILIRNKGDLNRKYEFASNEIIRMESKGYTWDEDNNHRSRQREELKLKSSVESFIAVMKIVQNGCNKSNKRQNDDIFACSRSKQTEDDHHKISKRSRIMETSTPQHYRVQPLLELEQSPVDPDCNMEIYGMDSSGGSNVGVHSKELESPTVYKAMESMKVATRKTEDVVLTKARLNVTAIEHGDSHESFRQRAMSLPLHSARNIIKKPKLGKDKSGSMSGIDFSSSVVGIDFSNWNSDDSVGYALKKEIFLEPWVAESGSYGMEYLFLDEDEKEDMDVRKLVEDITRNKLHEIFIKTCTRPLICYRTTNIRARDIPGALVTPGKRRTSFLPDPDSSRPTKAACRHQGGTTKARAQSIGGSPILKNLKKEKKTKSRTRAMSIPGQQLLTKWYSNKEQK